MQPRGHIEVSWSIQAMYQIRVKSSYLYLLKIAQSGERTDFGSKTWFKSSWINPSVCHYFSSNKLNARLLTYVFTADDPKSEWRKHDESNRVYWFEKRF